MNQTGTIVFVLHSPCTTTVCFTLRIGCCGLQAWEDNKAGMSQRRR